MTLCLEKTIFSCVPYLRLPLHNTRTAVNAFLVIPTNYPNCALNVFTVTQQNTQAALNVFTVTLQNTHAAINIFTVTTTKYPNYC